MYVSTQRWKSSKCTLSAQPTPHSCSSVRPVKSSQVWLKKVHIESVRAIHRSTGAASAMMRKRDSSSAARRSASRAANTRASTSLSLTAAPRAARP